jgi:hypothetical protein
MQATITKSKVAKTPISRPTAIIAANSRKNPEMTKSGKNLNTGPRFSDCLALDLGRWVLYIGGPTPRRQLAAGD